MNRQTVRRFFYLILAFSLGSAAFAKPAHAGPTHPTHRARTAHVQESAHARRHLAGLSHARPVVAAATVVTVRSRSGARVRRTVLVRHRYYEHFSASSFTNEDITQGDVTAGEDPVVRHPA